MNIPQILTALTIGYLFGNIPNGYLYARSQGVDIFREGSGNPGSTNVLRTLGKKAGLTVLLMDIAKTLVPILLLHMLWKPATEEMAVLLTLYTGIGAILGHNYPFIPGIRGGKGVACTGALIIAFDWRLAVVLLSVFVLLVLATGYVSLASMIAASGFFFFVLLLGKSGLLPVREAIYFQCCLLSLFVSALCIFQHRSNIKRLLAGTENRFGRKGKRA